MDRRQLKLYCVHILVLFAISGCVTQPVPEESGLSATQMHTPQTAIVTVGDLKGVLDSDTTISWFDKDLIDLSDSKLLSADEANEVHLFLKRRIQEEFVKKGVKFSTEAGSTRFQILVAGAGTTTSTEHLHSLFKIYPGLGTSELTRGAVMVGVLDTARNYAIWRGVVEGTLSDDLSFDERVSRLDAVITRLMSKVEI